ERLCGWRAAFTPKAIIARSFGSRSASRLLCATASAHSGFTPSIVQQATCAAAQYMQWRSTEIATNINSLIQRGICPPTRMFFTASQLPRATSGACPWVMMKLGAAGKPIPLWNSSYTTSAAGEAVAGRQGGMWGTLNDNTGALLLSLYAGTHAMRPGTSRGGERREAALAEAGARGGDVADHAQAGARRGGGGHGGDTRRRDHRQAVDPLDDRLELLALGGGHGEVHLEDAEPAFRGVDEHVGIGQAREQRQVERGEEALERLVDGVGLAHTVRHHAEPDVVGADLPGEQQVADEVGGGVDVDRRRRDRNQDAMRARQHFLQREAGGAGGRVDDQLARVVGNVHAEAAQPGLLRRGVGAVDLARRRRADAQPVEGRALRVVIHHRRGDAVGGEVAGEVGRDGGLSRPALRIDHQCGIGPHPLAAAYARPYDLAVNYCSSRVENNGMRQLLVHSERIAALLKERRETVAVAESAAGGLITAALL